MNKTLPTGRLCDTEAEKKASNRKRSKLRAIEPGTNYDIAGRLRKMTHMVEGGGLGRVTDIVAAVRYIDSENIVRIKTFYTGSSQFEVLHFMAERLKTEIMK